MTINKYIIISSLALLSVLSSCTSEDGITTDNTTDQGATILISTVDNGNATRSVASSGTNDGTANEGIKSYTLYVVDDNTNTVEMIINRPSSNTSLVKSEKIKIDNNFSDGSKTIYAIGNITPAQAGITLKEGDVVNAATMRKMVYNASAGNGFTIDATAGTYIPLSNIVKVSGISTQYDIPLYRMFAKIQFDITNNTANSLKIKNIGISSVTKDYIYLFPEDYVNFTADRTDYAKAPVLPATASDTYFTGLVGTSLNVGEKTSTSFYINESKAPAATKQLGFTVTTTQTDNDEDRYTLTDFSYINRNDYDIIPVVLSEYIFSPVVYYYPPIGGYPQANITDTDGKYYCTFNTGGGAFSITPNIRKAGDTAPLNCSSVTFTNDNPSLFTTPPTYNTTDGTINGALDTNPGTALLTFTFKVSTSLTLVRKLYISVE